MRRVRGLPPPPARASPWWVVASVLVHAVAAGLVLVTTRRVFEVEPTVVILLPGEGGAVEMPWASLGEPGAAPQRRPGGPAARRTGGRGEPAVAPETVPDSVRAGGPPDRPGAEGPGAGLPAGERAGEGAREATGRPGSRLLGARLGDGRLWVRPWDAIAAAIAGAGRDSIDAAAHVALIDSAITARIVAFLDTLPPDSFATQRPPAWVTEIDGKKWGVDGSWIYLGGLKLPSAILALIPLPQGNYDAAKHNAELQRIREDIIQAARRAESASEFRQYVKETRARRDAEREAKKNQKVPPDSIKT